MWSRDRITQGYSALLTTWWIFYFKIAQRVNLIFSIKLSSKINFAYMIWIWIRKFSSNHSIIELTKQLSQNFNILFQKYFSSLLNYPCIKLLLWTLSILYLLFNTKSILEYVWKMFYINCTSQFARDFLWMGAV